MTSIGISLFSHRPQIHLIRAERAAFVPSTGRAAAIHANSVVFPCETQTFSSHNASVPSTASAGRRRQRERGFNALIPSFGDFFYLIFDFLSLNYS